MQLTATFQRLLFRWRSDGTGPLRLSQRRIFIVPSRGGLLLAVALVLMLLGAINYNLALGHALVFLLAGLALVAMVHTFRNLHGLVITPARSEAVFAGDTALFPLTLDNERPTPRPALTLSAPGGLDVTVTVNGKNSAKIRIPLPASQRGWLVLPRVRLSTQYPLGLFTAWAYLQPEMRCLVFPQPVESPFPAGHPAYQGSDSRGDGGQEDFAGFRERQPADSLRHVAWKAAARETRNTPLLVKQFAGGARSEHHFDWSDTDPEQSTDVRLGILTGWVLKADAAAADYSLRLGTLEIPAGHGAAHRQRCLEALALFPT